VIQIIYFDVNAGYKRPKKIKQGVDIFYSSIFVSLCNNKKPFVSNDLHFWLNYCFDL